MTASANTKCLVLIVEDDPVIRIAAADSLREAGHDALEASNSDDAVDLLVTRGDIQVVFTDVEIPGSFSGFELAATIHENWPQTRVVVTSGVTMPQGHELPDTITFLPKPYTPGTLVQRIASLH